MSGRKYSTFEIAEERRRALALVESVRRLREEAVELRGKLAETLDGATEGLKSTFPREVERAQAWLEQDRSTGPVGLDTPRVAAQAAQRQLRDAVEAGRRTHRDLVVALTQKADTLGARLTNKLIDAEERHLRHRQLLEAWFPQEAAGFDATVTQAHELLAADRYPDLDRLLDDLMGAEEGVANQAAALAEKHERRLYLLDGLLATCEDLGFRTISTPSAEEREPIREPLSLVVDTLDRGKIAFTITLDEIQTDSGVLDTYCPTEFGELSKRLQEQFGIATAFKSVDTGPLPTGRARGERDLPHGTTAQR